MGIVFKAKADSLVTSEHDGTDATEGVSINGVKVLGQQGAAVANATDAASVITQLNALLARLRTHGLIAT